MRVGMNLLFCVPNEVGASEPLMTNLAERVASSNVDVVVFGVKGFSKSYPGIASRAEVVEVPWRGGNQALRISAENTWLRNQAKRLGLDLVHHGGGTAPFASSTKTALTLHDIQYIHHPGNFSSPKRAWLRLNVPRAARSSDLIMVTTDWVKNDISRHFGIEPSRFAVVPFGSEGLFTHEPEDTGTVKDTYGLDKPYFYYPSRTYPHKNHIGFLKAFEPLKDEADLIFTGGRWFRDHEVAEAIASAGLDGHVRMLGQLPRSHLRGLYEGAVALVYPTQFEGFGGPVLEAMSVGCPVIASNATSVPEVVAEAGLLIDPDDAASWTDAMAKVLHDSTLADDLANRGRRRAKDFSWDVSAKQLIRAYEKTLE